MLRNLSTSASHTRTKARRRNYLTAVGWLLLGVLAAVLLRYVASHRFIITPGGEVSQRKGNNDFGNPPDASMQSKDKPGAGPYLELQKIVPYGRILELIGRIEAGSKLLIDNERVSVSGDGVFKHFTKQFPVSNDRVRLELVVTDLSGRSRTITAFHDFRPGGKSN
jgi:hypothetical protein